MNNKATVEVEIKVDQTELDKAIEKAKWLEQFEKEHSLDTAQNLRRILKRKNKALSKAIQTLRKYDFCPLTYFKMVEDKDAYREAKKKIDCKNCIEDHEKCWLRFLLDEE